MNILEEQPFLAIVLATNRPAHVSAFLANLAETAYDQSSFEVLIRADEGDDATITAITAAQQQYQFRIYLLIEKNRKGTFLLHHAYDRLIKEFSSPGVYFFWNLTDEIRINTTGWDSILKQYVKWYDDDLFRLKPTLNNINNYYHFLQCLSLPDNYSLLTRRWMELVDGWGDYWGTDSWHQCIDWYLGKCQISEVPHGVFRSIPIFNLTLAGQGSGEVLSAGQSADNRMRMAKESFAVLQTLAARENFNRLAKRLYAHYLARKNGLDSYIIREDRQAKRTIIVTPDNHILDVFDWNLRFENIKDWMTRSCFRYFGAKNGSLIVEIGKHIAERSKKFRLLCIRSYLSVQFRIVEQLRHRSGYTLNTPPVNTYTEYHFTNGKNHYFPSDYFTIRQKIDRL